MQTEQHDWELLQEYVRTGSEPAFEQLVRRYVDHVYGMALRQLNDPELAKDVTQAVFLVLIKKARALPDGTILLAWLFTTTRYVAQTLLRTEQRRVQRELSVMNELADMDPAAEASWGQLSPHIDEALASLKEKDRQILLLRFFQSQSLRDVGAALGMSEDAVQKRTTRAVERLKHFFEIRGIGVSALALATALSANAAPPAPADVVPAVMAMVTAPASADASVLSTAKNVEFAGYTKIVIATVGLSLLALLPLSAYLVSRLTPTERVMFDLSRDFSLDSNPNGAWGFGSKETPEGPLTLNSHRRVIPVGGEPEEAWEYTPGRFPAIYRNASSTGTIFTPWGEFPPQTVWFTAGEDWTSRNFGAIRCTIPPGAAGRYRVEANAATALSGRAAGDGDFHVVFNGGVLFSQALAPNSVTGCTNELLLSVGDTVDFLAGRGPDGRQVASVLKIRATFTWLPK